MPNIIRMAKSAGDWVANDLRAYNITVENWDSTQFFGRHRRSTNHLNLDHFVLIPAGITAGISLQIHRILEYLISDSTTILLVIQEDKTTTNQHNPEPQLIAEAIATYQYNNEKHSDLYDGLTLIPVTWLRPFPRVNKLDPFMILVHYLFIICAREIYIINLPIRSNQLFCWLC